MNSSQRESARQKDANSRRILDDAARRRRARKALEALEQDNFHDDPHANLGITITFHNYVFIKKNSHLLIFFVLFLSSS